MSCRLIPPAHHLRTRGDSPAMRAALERIERETPLAIARVRTRFAELTAATERRRLASPDHDRNPDPEAF